MTHFVPLNAFPAIVNQRPKHLQYKDCTEMEERRDIFVRPNISTDLATSLVREIFGIEVANTDSIFELDSYEDRNFCLHAESSEGEACLTETDPSVCQNKRYILKVMNAKCTYSQEGIVEATDAAMKHIQCLEKEGILCPVPLAAKNGAMKILVTINTRRDSICGEMMKTIENIGHSKSANSAGIKFGTDEDGNEVVMLKHYVRLLSFVPGKIFPCGELDDDLLFQTGKLAANIIKVFKDFSCPALVNKQDIWDMKNLLELWKPKYLDPLKDINKRIMAETVFSLFESNVASVISDLPMQTIHSDLNEQNIIIQNHNGRRNITGLIDFGDITHSCRIFEIGTCISYIGLLKVDDFNWIAGTILAGYLSEEDLTQLELDVLYYCVIGRLAMSLVIGNYQHSLSDPSNDYLLNTSKTGWKLLDILLESKDCVQKIVGIWLGYCKEKAK